MVGWVAGLIEIITNSVQLKLKLGLSLAIFEVFKKVIAIMDEADGNNALVLSLIYQI